MEAIELSWAFLQFFFYGRMVLGKLDTQRIRYAKIGHVMKYFDRNFYILTHLRVHFVFVLTRTLGSAVLLPTAVTTFFQLFHSVKLLGLVLRILGAVIDIVVDGKSVACFCLSLTKRRAEVQRVMQRLWS